VTTADPPLPALPFPEGATRVATVPNTGPYVDAVLPPDVVRVGPVVDPSPWLAIDHLIEHADEIDVLHLHAGYAHAAEAAVQCWAETVRRLGIPLVVTVHQLRDPDGRGHAGYDAHLEAVLATAEVVFTLTPGAADEIADRFGRTAIVVAHPSVTVPDPELGAERGLVGLLLGADVPEQRQLVRAALSGAVSGGGRLRVLVEGSDAALDPVVRELAARGELEVVVHAPADRAAQLQQVHVAVLAERYGTHSGDVELCRDVGTRVVAPRCGFFADQWSEVVSYGCDERGRLDSVSLTAAIGAALTRPMLRPADRAWREEQKAAVRQVHGEVYAQVAGDRSWV
jgi:hypothetical protein